MEKALKQWQNADAAAGLTSLSLFQKLHQTGNGNVRQTANQLLLTGLQALEAEKPRLAHILRLRFLSYLPVDQTAIKLGLEESTIYALQREALLRLAQLIQQQDSESRREIQQTLVQRLDSPTYTTLVGVEPHLAQLFPLLTKPEPPWLIAVEGMGGIGKTALADQIVRQLLSLSAVNAVGWVTARPPDFDLGGGLASLQKPALSTQELIQRLVAQVALADPVIVTLPAEKQLTWLQSQLQVQPHLIVIDNLETVLDVETLLPVLHRLSNPTRFLLTSRERVEGVPGLYHFTVPELQEADAMALVRQEAMLGNLSHLVDATAAELRPIYTTVGGNPLALRLVVGQTHADSLAFILDDLAQARGKTAEHLYTYIYRHAWERLDERTRRVWLALPLLTAAQATPAALVEISGEALPSVRAALAQLVRLNLVYAHGGVNERFYTLHNLTRTFLQEQVGQWQ
ncbi:MAG: hypothetical protein KF832_11750 [Caldilineaceae bacterium]|nr:hypothetical protein [Caldilineaceae bacterium]